jgi:hypothetical protein
MIKVYQKTRDIVYQDEEKIQIPGMVLAKNKENKMGKVWRGGRGWGEVGGGGGEVGGGEVGGSGRGGCIRQPEMKTEVTMPKTIFVFEKNRLIGYICMSITYGKSHIGIRKEEPVAEFIDP